ncbi:Arogenate dehydratase 3, chloroplastic [Hordeum vulgare]|nr:Arogenate dehydratase 3, chloroplastic [Hordeum vulgare]
MGEASGEGLKVAYQGCPGAYGEAAANKAYPSCETVPYEYFETAFQVPPVSLLLIIITAACLLACSPWNNFSSEALLMLTFHQLWFGLEAGRVHAMALETKQVGLCIKKVLRSAPGFFAFLLSSSPVIICTTLLLGILLSYGDTDLPEANDEDTKTTPEIPSLKMQNPNCKVMVDNCYGEFVETSEPPMVGADLIVGSLIKNPGGTIAPCGGYVAGKKDLVAAAAAHLSAPGLGWSLGQHLDMLCEQCFRVCFLHRKWLERQ